MDSTNSMGYVKLAAMLLLSLLLASSPAVAEGEYLSQFSSDNYHDPGDDTSGLWALSDSESSSDTAVAIGEYLNKFSSGDYLGQEDDKSDLWAQSDGDSQSEAGSEQASSHDASKMDT